MLFGEHPDVEPAPAADEHAQIVIVRPAVVDFNRSDGAGPAEPVGQLRQHAIGGGPRLAPEAIFRDGAGAQAVRARFAQRQSGRGW
jgi:hypothetical protein